jgi:hypothetical protein
MTRTHASLALMLALSACSASPPPDDTAAVGSARAAITQVPPSVSCIRLVAAGTRTVINNFDVTPGQSATLTMTNLPVGNLTFTGFAYGSTCALVANDQQPLWASAPTAATIIPGQTTSLALTLVEVGNATVTINFDTDGGVLDMSVPPDLTSCLPPGATCKLNSDCCSGTCSLTFPFPMRCM